MPDFREVREAETKADEAAARALDSDNAEYATVHLLDAIRLEIRAQGMRFDYSMTEAAKQ